MRPDFTALLLWITEAATIFLNGALSGMGGSGLTGSGAGAYAANATPAGTSGGLMVAGITWLLGMIANGLKRVQVWHAAHPIPNPWRPLADPPGLPPIDPADVFKKLP